MTEYADATPTKRFFVDMLTRDIAFEDAVLDLVDNCIDSLSRSRGIVLDEKLLDATFVNRRAEKMRADGIPRINIEVSANVFRIEDTCGGIPLKKAKDDVFRFGRVVDDSKSRLSVYGIGLKRAMFKIGRKITVESRTASDGFIVDIDTQDWLSRPDEWRFPLTEIKPASSQQRAGTKIEILSLNDEIKMRISDSHLITRLTDAIASAYGLILEKFVTVTLNGSRVKPKGIPLGMSDKAKPATDQLNIDGVRLTLIAGLAERVDEEWKLESAGWYVLCNGRVVVYADKGDLTGWGDGAPHFVSKFRGFVGIAFFFSEDPELLPWTTTKKGLHRESRAYQVAKARMGTLARPVLSFLNKMYPAGEYEEPQERNIAETIKRTSIGVALKAATNTFQTPQPDQAKGPRLVSVQYKARASDLERARKHLRRSSWAAGRIGLYTFRYFLEKECPE